MSNHNIVCQPGSLDQTFNHTGIQPGTIAFAINNHIAGNNEATAVLLDHQGKIVLGGFSSENDSNPQNFALARLNTDGTIDRTFNEFGLQPGTTTTTINLNSSHSAQAQALALQLDHKILLAGYIINSDYSNASFALARFNYDGSLDTSFNHTGNQPGTVVSSVNNYAINKCYAIALQPDQKIILAGACQSSISSSNQFALARFNQNGSLDTSFNPTGSQPGTVLTNINLSPDNCIGQSVIVQPNGKIIIAGYIANSDYSCVEFAVAKFNQDGSLDTSFNQNGIQPGTMSTTIDYNNYNFCSTIALQKDHKIVLGGLTAGNVILPAKFAIARLNNDGSLDHSFNPSGIEPGTTSTTIDLVNDFFATGSAIAIQPNQKIIVGGYLARPDRNYTKFALARFKTDGSLDTIFNRNGSQPGTISTNINGNIVYNLCSAIALEPNGKIVLAGISSDDSTNINNFAAARFTIVPATSNPNCLAAKLMNKYNQLI